MTQPPDITEPPWWKSKKLWAYVMGLVAVLIALVIVALLALDSTVAAAAIASITGQSISHATNQGRVDTAQANSPYYPSGGSYHPNTGTNSNPGDLT